MDHPLCITFRNETIGIVNGKAFENQRNTVGCASMGHTKPVILNVELLCV